MGKFGKAIRNIGHSIGEFFKSPLKSIGHAVGSAFHETATIIADTERTIMSPFIQSGTKVIQTSGQAISSILDPITTNLSMPLVIGGIALVLILLAK